MEFLHHKRQRPLVLSGTTRWEEHRNFGGCFPVPVGAHTADKYAGDRKTKGL